MQGEQTIIQRDGNGGTATWVPRTLDQLGKMEEFLEEALADAPSLLRLETKRSGIYGPFVPFRQLSFQTPQGRSIAPDIVFLTASGHVVVVEVKRFVNPELRDRRVIAQVVDYAASFSALTEAEAQELFMKEKASTGTWEGFVQELFPGDGLWEELAEEFVRKLAAGQLNLVVACDRAPAGLAELIEGVAAQSAIEFQLELVEVSPYVRKGEEEGSILLVPRTRLATEIVARTAVTVFFQGGGERPAVDVQTSSLEDIEENVRAASQGTDRGRTWTPEETAEAVRNGDDPVMIEFLEFCVENSSGGQIVSPGVRTAPSFAFHVPARNKRGDRKNYQVARCSLGWGLMTIYLNTVETCGGEAVLRGFAKRMEEVFGSSFDSSRPEPGLPMENVGDHMKEFQQSLIWLRDELEQLDVAGGLGSY